MKFQYISTPAFISRPYTTAYKLLTNQYKNGGVHVAGATWNPLCLTWKDAYTTADGGAAAGRACNSRIGAGARAIASAAPTW